MQQVGYQQVNMLGDQLQEDLEFRNSKVVTMLQNMLETCSQSTPGIATLDKSGTSTIITQEANAVVNDNTQILKLELLCQIIKVM